MASRSLRNRTVDPSKDEQHLLAGESAVESEILGSVGELELDRQGQQSDLHDTPLSEPYQPSQDTVTQPNIQPPNPSETSDLKQMLASMFPMMQETVRADISSVKEDLANNQESVRKDLAANQETVRADFSSVKADLKCKGRPSCK
jgi:hypothetical protein